jgi:hypothetical protein
MKRAAKTAPRPVKGVVGSKLAAAALELVDEDPGALDAALGLVLGWVWPFAQVYTPLTIEFALSLSNCVQSKVVLEVWMFSPPRTSLSAGSDALGEICVSCRLPGMGRDTAYVSKVPAKSRAPTIV